MSMTKPRAYRSYDHLCSLATNDAGSIWMVPVRGTSIYFDAAKANYLPRNLPTGDHGSTILDIGQGVQVRASGHVSLVDGAWTIDPAYFYVDAYRGGSITPKRMQRAREVCLSIARDWIATHADELSEAETIDRNNGARTLEETIARHADALRILRKELRACESGRSFTQYPDLPTKRG